MLHMSRVQVILSEEEREAFRRRAEARGTSLSAWLRDAGRQQLERERGAMLGDAAAVRQFFAALRDEPLDREPDWDEHRGALADSRVAGLPGT